MISLEHEDLEAPPALPISAALFLDFDGTLAGIAPRPDEVKVDSGLPPLLNALHARLGGAIAIITGRQLREVDALLAPIKLLGAGVHGAEMRQHGDADPLLNKTRAITELATFLRERFSDDPRLLVEDKDAAVSLHFRLAPERADECTFTMRALAEPLALEVIVDNMVVEARTADANKGKALRLLVAQPPFNKRIPVFVGDGEADEEAFSVAREFGGYGIKVGNGPTCALYRCAGVEEVSAWLRSSLNAYDQQPL